MAPDRVRGAVRFAIPRRLPTFNPVTEYAAPPMSWSLKFDEPIELAKCKALRTLRDAGELVAALPRKEASLPHWQLAAQCLLSAAEHAAWRAARRMTGRN
jgi:hypothetical protein